MRAGARPRRGSAPKSDSAREAEVPRPGLAARKAAARLLSAVVDTHTSLDGLTDAQGGHPQYRALDARDRALVRAILATALRYRVTIGKMIERELDRPLPPNAHALSHILHVAAAQILFLDVPDSAAVDLAVSHAKGDPRVARDHRRLGNRRGRRQAGRRIDQMMRLAPCTEPTAFQGRRGRDTTAA